MSDLLVGVCLIAVVITQAITIWRQGQFLRKAWAREDQYQNLLRTFRPAPPSQPLLSAFCTCGSTSVQPCAIHGGVTISSGGSNATRL